MEKYAETPILVKPFYEAPIRLPFHKVPDDCSGCPLYERFEALFPEVLHLRELRGDTLTLTLAAVTGYLTHMQPRRPTRLALTDADQCADSLTVQAFEMWKAYLLLADTILEAMFTESNQLELMVALIGTRSRIALYHIENLLRAMRIALDAVDALEQVAVKQYTESRLDKIINAVLDSLNLRLPHERYRKTAIGIVAAHLQVVHTYLSDCIVHTLQAKSSLEGMAERLSPENYRNAKRSPRRAHTGSPLREGSIVRSIAGGSALAQPAAYRANVAGIPLTKRA